MPKLSVRVVSYEGGGKKRESGRRPIGWQRRLDWQYARVSDLHRRVQQLLASMLSSTTQSPKDKER